MKIFTLAPISTVTLTELLSLYVIYLLIAYIVIFPFTLVYKERGKLRTSDYSTILITVPIEDFIFRFLPIYFFNGDVNIAFTSHIIWAILHGFPSCIAVGILGILFLRLWLGGLWSIALILHILHDIFIVSVIKLVGGKVRA